MPSSSIYRLFNYLTLLSLVSLAHISCTPTADSTKSELVQRLEGIFYDDFIDIPSGSFSANDYGAIGDSTTLNTVAIQKAIDAAHEAGGGQVTLKPGIYLSGALFVKSNVNLHLDEGVTIRAIQDDSAYPERPTRIAGFEMTWPAALINVYEQKNVKISGPGTIDGNGKFWWDKFWGDPPRSGGMWVDYERRNVRWAVDYDCKRLRPVVVYESQDVALEDFTVLRAGFWTVSLTYSERVYVNGLTIRNNIGGFGPSSDGINTDSSTDVLVENCDIDCNDDNLCIKSGRDADGLRVNRPAKNIVYRNCITRAGHGLFTIGSETSGGMQNIEVYGLTAKGTNTGIRFKSAQVRGGVIQDIYFHDITMNDVKSPFHFELNWYPEYSYPKIPDEIPDAEIPDRWRLMTIPVVPAAKGIPEFKNMRIENIKVEGARTAIYANAYPQKPMDNISWNNVSIEAKEAGKINYASNWSMDNVDITVPEDSKFVLMGSPNIELPSEKVTIQTIQDDASLQKRITKKAAQYHEASGASIIPINMTNQQLLSEGDTTTFSKDIAIYVYPVGPAAIEYIEPLGDGYYMTEVNIQHQAGTVSIAGEKEHNWRIHYPKDNQPKSVQGAQTWNYENGYVIIERTCSRCTISIQ